MDNSAEEKYVSLRIASGDITAAKKLFVSANALEDKYVKHSLVSYSIICLLRPFKKSYGKFKKAFIPLKKIEIFQNKINFFETLESERDSRIAHSDLSVRNPELHYWSKIDTFPIVLKSSTLNILSSEFSNKYFKTISIIESWLEFKITEIENEIKPN